MGLRQLSIPHFSQAAILTLRAVLKVSALYFAAKDLAEVLGFKDAFSATQMLDADEKLNLAVQGINRGLIFVNESGLYFAQRCGQSEMHSSIVG